MKDSPTYLGITLDTCLTWKNKINRSQRSNTRQRKEIVNKLAGTIWRVKPWYTKEKIYTEER